MTDANALVPIAERAVDFYGDQITALLVTEGERQQIYVPIRPLCDYLGVDWSAQRQRINRDPVLADVQMSVVVTTTDIDPESRRPRSSAMLCLPLDYLNGWLFGISASRVKEEIRDNLIRYQRECYRVLADAFLSPDVVVRPVDESESALMQLHNMALVIAATTREMLEVRRLALDNKTRLDAARDYLTGLNQRLKLVEQRTLAGPLTEEQAREIQHRVNLIAQELSKHEPGQKHHMGIYEALRQETGATSYKSIPPKGYETAVAFLDNWLSAIQSTSTPDDHP
jgi:hypothetical protein